MNLPTNNDINDFWVKEFAKSVRFTAAMDAVKGMTEASKNSIYDTLAFMFGSF